MSRQTNRMGLTPTAQGLLSDLLRLPDGERRCTGMFAGEEYPLYRYVAAVGSELASAQAELEASAADSPTV
jgi:hypothetical protein